jgi:hypothetical protein
VALAVEDLGAAQPRVGARPLGQPRLPDAGLADQHEKRAVAAERRVDGPLEPIQLEGAAHELAAAGPRRRLELRRRHGLGQRLARGIEASPHGRRARRARRRLLLEQLEHQRLEIRRHLGPVPGRRHRPRVQVLADHRHRVVPHEGGPPGQHLVQRGAEGVEIRARRDAAADGLLGRHVGGGAHHRALLGDAGAIERDGEAEVAELDGAVRGEPDVGGLEIAVDDALTVGVPEGCAELLGDVEGLLHGHAMTLALAEVLLEIAAGDVLADQIDAALPLVDVVHGDDVRVVSQAPHRLGLASHPGQLEPLALDEGDSHLAVEPCVPGEVDTFGE